VFAPPHGRLLAFNRSFLLVKAVLEALQLQAMLLVLGFGSVSELACLLARIAQQLAVTSGGFVQKPLSLLASAEDLLICDNLPQVVADQTSQKEGERDQYIYVVHISFSFDGLIEKNPILKE